MKNKKYLVITSSDSKYGDFLINHWLSSLRNNINLNKVDIAVVDYGLSLTQKKELASKGVLLVKGVRDGHVVNIRFRDMYNFLKTHKYEQILSCDSGDIIFQKDITSLFYENIKSFRAVFENMESNFMSYLLEQKPFDEKLEKKIMIWLKGKQIINGGLIIAPYKKFLLLCREMTHLIKNKNLYGPDQVILNYHLYKSDFVPLSPKFNYVVMNNRGLKVENSKFYDENNELIYVVHNAGGIDFLRAVRNFGYGKNYNQFSRTRYIIFRLFIKLHLLAIPKFFFKIKNLFYSSIQR